MKSLGTYDTIDVPADNSNKKLEAFAWLNNKVLEIGGRVRILQNPHDFGLYPSFEVDYPKGLEDIDDEPHSEDFEYNNEMFKKKQKFIDAMHIIEKEYCDKFFN